MLQRPTVLLATLALVLGTGCASGPTADDARELLEKGDPDGALRAAREAARNPDHDPLVVERARRVAFEAGLLLGRTDDAAREFLDLPESTRGGLAARLAGSTLGVALLGPDAARRAAAASELALVSPSARFPGLLELALHDPEPVVREAAVAAASAHPDPGVAALLLARVAVEDPADPVRDAAALALAGRIGRPRAGEPAEVAQARTQLLAAAPRARPSRALARAVEVLGDETVARSIADSLESETSAPGASGPDATAGLAARLAPAEGLSSRRYEDRLLAARALVARPDRTLVRALQALLADPVTPVRWVAADALGAAGDTRSLLDAARTNDDSATRRRALLAADRAAPLGFDPLVRFLEADDAATAPDAARLLAERGGAGAVAPLCRALARGCAEARSEAARGLGALGGPEALAALLEALAANEGAVRRAAARALVRGGSPAHEERLARAIAHPVEDSDLAAAAAMLAIEARSGGSASSTPVATQEGP